MVLEFMIIFFVIFVINYFINYILKNKHNNLIDNQALMFITKKYKLKLDDKKTKLLSKIIIIVNSLIISIPIELILRLNIKYLYSIIISFILFIFLILISYNLLGYILKKKGW